MSSTFDWTIVLDIGVGVGVFILGLGVLIATSALARTLARVNRTLDEVDRQIAEIGQPVGQALVHVNGMADSADKAVARLTVAAKQIEDAASSVSSTAKLAQEAIAPSIVNVGATLSGISAGLRHFFTGRNSGDGSVGDV